MGHRLHVSTVHCWHSVSSCFVFFITIYSHLSLSVAGQQSKKATQRCVEGQNMLSPTRLPPSLIMNMCPDQQIGILFWQSFVHLSSMVHGEIRICHCTVSSISKLWHSTDQILWKSLLFRITLGQSCQDHWVHPPAKRCLKIYKIILAKTKIKSGQELKKACFKKNLKMQLS